MSLFKPYWNLRLIPMCTHVEKRPFEAGIATVESLYSSGMMIVSISVHPMHMYRSIPMDNDYAL